MSQRENLWGRYRPCEGWSMQLLESRPGTGGPVQFSYRLHYHKPEPDVIVDFNIDEYGREGIPALISGVAKSYQVASATQSLLAVERGVLRIEQEYCP